MSLATLKVAHFGDILTDFSLEHSLVLLIPQLDLVDDYSYLALQIMPSKESVVTEFFDVSRSYRDVKHVETLKIPGLPQTMLVVKRNYGVLRALHKVGGVRAGPILVERGFKHFPVFIPHGSESKLLKYVKEFSPCRVTARISKTYPSLEDLPSTPALTEYEFRVLKIAYEKGFFEWPKKVRLEDLASALGISKATTAEHLRKALRKLVDTYLRAHSYVRWSS